MPEKRSSFTREKRRHGSVLIPYTYYDCMIPDYFLSVPLHWHGEFELNYVRCGQGLLRYEDRTIVLNSGDIILIQPNLLHAISPLDDVSLSYETLVFQPGMLRSNIDDRSYRELLHPLFTGAHAITVPISRTFDGYEPLHAAVTSIFRCIHENSPRSDLLLKSELLRLFYLIEGDAQFFCVNHPEEDHAEAMRPVLGYMQEHYKEPLTIAQLAGLMHLSPSYFMGRFKQIYGIGAIEYLNQLRIRSACRLLLDSRLTISEIAYESGFRNIANFNRQFKQKVGCSPSDYQRERRA